MLKSKENMSKKSEEKYQNRLDCCNKLKNLLIDNQENKEFLDEIVNLFNVISNEYKNGPDIKDKLNILQNSSNQVMLELFSLYKNYNFEKVKLIDKKKYSEMVKSPTNNFKEEFKKKNIEETKLSFNYNYNKNENSFPKDIIILSYIKLKNEEKNIVSIKGFMHINSLNKSDDKSFFVTQENECFLSNEGDISKLLDKKIKDNHLKPLNLDTITNIVGYRGLYDIKNIWIIPFIDFPFNLYNYKNKGQRFMPLINQSNEECPLFIDKFKYTKIYMSYNTSITPGIITNLIERRSKDNKVIKLYKLLVRYLFINKYKKTLNYRNTSVLVSPYIIKNHKINIGQLCLTTNIKCHNFCSSILLTVPINLCSYLQELKEDIPNKAKIGMNIDEDILKEYNIKNWLLQYKDIFNKLDKSIIRIEEKKFIVNYNDELLNFNIDNIKRYIKMNDTKKLYENIEYDEISDKYILNNINYYISSVEFSNNKTLERFGERGIYYYSSNNIYMLSCIN